MIVEAARELAEAEGWSAVTTRRLSERVEYSQPVLYSHFKGKDAIVTAVALDGFEELATTLRAAVGGGPCAPRALADAYLEFARTRPAVYEAMFVRDTDLVFGGEATPAPLKAAFEPFLAAVRPAAEARGEDRETLAELLWSTLHGLATLTRGHRLRPTHHDARVDLVVSAFTAR
ncbi:TetR/AcrR family transcriptional regulator [Streptomyces capparidis]